MGVDPAVLAAMQQMGLQVPQVAAPVVPMAPVPGAPAAPVPPAGPLAPPMEPPQMPPLPGPPGQPGEQPQVPPPFQPPPGVPGQPPMPQLPGQPPPPSPEELAAQEGLKDGAEAAREEGTDDTLGQGARPRRGSSMENPLDRAATQLSSELQGMASQLASDLFPNGPAGTVRPSNEALGSYMRRHWDDPAFRQVMLDRMAPKGPDGKRVPWGVKAFLKLYKESIAPRGVSNDLTQPVVGPTGFTSFPSNPPPQLEAPPEPAQVTQITEVPPEEGD